MFVKLHLAAKYGGSLAGGLALLILILFFINLLTPDEKATQGETASFSIKEAETFSDVNGFETNNSIFSIDNSNGYGDKIVPDRTGKLHEKAIFIINEFSEDSNVKDPYIVLEVDEFKGKLKQYDSFKTTLSINPEQKDYEGLDYQEILWGSSESDELMYLQQTKSKMNFIFINENDEVLGDYTIDKNNTLPVEVDLKNSKRLFIVVQSDNKDLFVGGMYSSTLVKY